MDSNSVKKETQLANDFLAFVNGSPSHFHAVEQARTMLKENGFTQIEEKNPAHWQFKPNGKYFFTRNQTSILAFAVGGQWKPGHGFTIAGAHTDSPVLKVKPISKIVKHGFLQVGVEVYGGGLWTTWFDRDLSLAGRVIVAKEDNKSFESRLVHIKRPIMRIPMLAIHLNRDISSEGFKPNFENHLVPVLASQVKAQLSSKKFVDGDKKEAKSEEPESHQSILLSLLAEELNTKPEQIRDFELCLYDTQPAAVGGALNEFIFSRALDNLMMSFVTLRALIDGADNKSLDADTQIRTVALFDNEEIGSQSVAGADSSLLQDVLERITNNMSLHQCALRRSILVSADMAHALHPNYAEKHEENHRPHMHKGLVIKQNANQRYASNSTSTFLLNEIARRHSIPVQKFVVRNDTGCGSTIGPILSAKCGIRTVDVGIPQLSMHSIREMCGVGDVAHAYELIKSFYQEFAEVDASLHISHE